MYAKNRNIISMYHDIVAIGTPNLTKKTKRKIIRFTNSFVFGIIFGNFEFVQTPSWKLILFIALFISKYYTRIEDFYAIKKVQYDLTSLLK